MTVAFAYAILRNFVVLTAMLLTIKNIAWCGELLAVHLRGEDYKAFSHRIYTTEEWIIRAGSMLIALASLFALAIAAAEHFVTWLHPTAYTIPFAFMSLICLQTLMIWRLLFFTKRGGYMMLSLAGLAALSILAEVAQ